MGGCPRSIGESWLMGGDVWLDAFISRILTQFPLALRYSLWTAADKQVIYPKNKLISKTNTLKRLSPDVCLSEIVT